MNIFDILTGFGYNVEDVFFRKKYLRVEYEDRPLDSIRISRINGIIELRDYLFKEDLILRRNLSQGDLYAVINYHGDKTWAKSFEYPYQIQHLLRRDTGILLKFIEKQILEPEVKKNIIELIIEAKGYVVNNVKARPRWDSVGHN